MKQKTRWIAATLMAALLVSPLAEAKRAGGGRSHGMSRPSYSQPRQQQAPAQNTQATPQRRGSNVGNVVAAGAAGAAIGALATHALADNGAASGAAETGSESGGFNWLWLAVLGGLAFFAVRAFGARKKANVNLPDNNGRLSHDISFGSRLGASGSALQGDRLPDGTDAAVFLRIARQRFNHIQAMNSAVNIEEIRRYLTPDLYRSMYQDIMANRDEDVAEFSNLNAAIAGSATENGQYIVSVRFSGMVSEELNAQPQPFAEVWHFVKNVGSLDDWLVAGIQQA